MHTSELEKKETTKTRWINAIAKMTNWFISAGFIMWGWNVFAWEMNLPQFDYWEIFAMRMALSNIMVILWQKNT